MFELDRTFSQRNMQTGLMQWYFNAREGLFGPYETKKMAQDELRIFVERRKLSGDDGGRGDAEKKGKLSLQPIEHKQTEPIFFDYAKRKKGIDE